MASLKVSITFNEVPREAGVDLFWIIQDELQAAKVYNGYTKEIVVGLEYKDQSVHVTVPSKQSRFVNAPVTWELS